MLTTIPPTPHRHDAAHTHDAGDCHQPADRDDVAVAYLVFPPCHNLKVKAEADTDEDTDTDTHANPNRASAAEHALFLTVPCHPRFPHAHACAARRSRLLTAATGPGQLTQRGPQEPGRSRDSTERARHHPEPPGTAVAQAPRVARRRL